MLDAENFTLLVVNIFVYYRIRRCNMQYLRPHLMILLWLLLIVIFLFTIAFAHCNMQYLCEILFLQRGKLGFSPHLMKDKKVILQQ